MMLPLSTTSLMASLCTSPLGVTSPLSFDGSREANLILIDFFLSMLPCNVIFLFFSELALSLAILAFASLSLLRLVLKLASTSELP